MEVVIITNSGIATNLSEGIPVVIGPGILINFSEIHVHP